MSAPKRIQRSRAKGWRMPADAIYVGRPTRWGNPYSVGGPLVIEADRGRDCGLQHELDGRLGITAAQAVDGYRDLMALRLSLAPYTELGFDEEEYEGRWRRDVGTLAGHDLVCWCPLDQPCHADVLLELANRDRV